MAIQAHITLDNGIDMSEAYVVVAGVALDVIPSDSSTASIQVIVYKNVDTRDAGKPEVIDFKHFVTGEDYGTYFSNTVLDQLNKNPIKQSYEYIKTLPMYVGATDV